MKNLRKSWTLLAVIALGAILSLFYARRATALPQTKADPGGTVIEYTGTLDIVVGDQSTITMDVLNLSGHTVTAKTPSLINFDGTSVFTTSSLITLLPGGVIHFPSVGDWTTAPGNTAISPDGRSTGTLPNRFYSTFEYQLDVDGSNPFIRFTTTIHSPTGLFVFNSRERQLCEGIEKTITEALLEQNRCRDEMFLERLFEK